MKAQSYQNVKGRDKKCKEVILQRLFEKVKQLLA